MYYNNKWPCTMSKIAMGKVSEIIFWISTWIGHRFSSPHICQILGQNSRQFGIIDVVEEFCDHEYLVSSKFWEGRSMEKNEFISNVFHLDEMRHWFLKASHPDFRIQKNSTQRYFSMRTSKFSTKLYVFFFICKR